MPVPRFFAPNHLIYERKLRPLLDSIVVTGTLVARILRNYDERRGQAATAAQGPTCDSSQAVVVIKGQSQALAAVRRRLDAE